MQVMVNDENNRNSAAEGSAAGAEAEDKAAAASEATVKAKTEKNPQKSYLTCEKDWVYYTLIFIAGIYGSYTYLLKGEVFCNAQTGNVVLMGMALGSGKWGEGLYYLIPITAYISGSMLSELLPNPIKHRLPVRWDTILIAIEMLIVAMLGFVPDSAPVQISQVAINFIASMQYNTFRQAEGIPVATTFATNHVRQIGIGIAKEIKHRHDPEKPHRKKLAKHFHMLLFFLSGAILGTIAGNLVTGRAIWIALVPLAVIFFTLLHADLTTEKDLLGKIPSGH